MKSLVYLGLVLLVVGCATQTGYQPADRRGGQGYSEAQLGENRYRVVFTGNYSTPAETVRDYALLRAAELTLQEGYDWFRLADREGDKTSRTTLSGTGVGVSGFHRGFYGPGFVGAGVGTATATTRDSHSYFLEFITGKGEFDKEDAAVYDARNTAATIRRWMATQ